jgi:hypothetical protein
MGTVLGLALSLMFLVGCSTANFSGGSKEAKPKVDDVQKASPPAVPVDDPVEPPAVFEGDATAQEPECVEGDPIEIKWPVQIQACLDQGKLFNFDTKQCAGVTKAQYDCNFPGVLDAIVRVGLNEPNKLVAASQSANPKGYMVGCGQSADQQTVIAQWIMVPAVKTCTFEPAQAGVTTACYRNFGYEAVPPLDTPEQYRAFVAKCMADNGI